MQWAAAQTQGVIHIASPSVMSLFLRSRLRGQPLATGTGFVVNSPKGPVLLTAKHVVTCHTPDGKPLLPDGSFPDELEIRHNRKDQLGSWVIKIKPLRRDGKPIWIEPSAPTGKADYVALPLTQVDDIGFYFYELTDTLHIAVTPADSVSVIGFPFGITAQGLAVWATGFIASDLDVDLQGLPLFLIDCRSREGQSGSPVIAYRGHGEVPTEGGGDHVQWPSL